MKTRISDIDLNLLIRGINSVNKEETLAVLRELFALAERIRSENDTPDDSGNTPENKPWRQFRAVVGSQLFARLLGIVRYDPPSRARELAGDMMVLLRHPCAVGRLLELYERRVHTINDSPAWAVYKGLCGIGTGGAARALMWLWGTRWDADVSGALGACRSGAAQNFLVKQAVAHANTHVRQMCIGHLKLPLTKEKAGLFIDRLKNGEYNERFTAIVKVQELRVVCAADTLMSMRGESRNKSLVVFIDQALKALTPDYLVRS